MPSAIVKWDAETDSKLKAFANKNSLKSSKAEVVTLILKEYLKDVTV